MAITPEIEVLTLFVDDLSAARSFYQMVFDPKPVFEDDVSLVLDFGGVMVNLLRSSEAAGLTSPAQVTRATNGTSMLLTVRVPDVDATCAELQRKGVKLLNGPQNQPWGRRTATFADPSGHVWEIAQELK